MSATTKMEALLDPSMEQVAAVPLMTVANCGLSNLVDITPCS